VASHRNVDVEQNKACLNGLTLVFDEQTGNLLRLAHPATGVMLQAPPEAAGLLDLAYPVPAFTPMRLASGFSAARLEQGKDELTITWEALSPSRSNFPLPAGKVSAAVTVRAAPDGRSVIMSCHIENRSEAPIPQVIFPDLRGLKPFVGPEQTQLRLPGGIVRLFAEPPRPPHTAGFYAQRGWNEYAPTAFNGGLNILRWLDVGSHKGGVSVFQRKWNTPDWPIVRTYRSDADPMSLRLLWDHKTTIEPGQSWESGEFWLTPHPGGWAKGIEVFREYVRQVNPPRELPAHVREGLGCQTVWMAQSLEPDPAKAAFRFHDLPTIAQDAKEHGIDELVLWGWCDYFLLPILVNSALGTQEEFIAAIRQAQALGVNVAPFVSLQTVREGPAERYGLQAGDPTWAYHPDLVPNFRCYYAKPWREAWVESDNPIWLKEVEEELTKWINLGVTSFSWDQVASKIGPDGKSAYIDMIQRIRSQARAKDPESTFSGELAMPGSLEREGAILDYTWNWYLLPSRVDDFPHIGGQYMDAAPVLNVLRSPRLNVLVEDSALVVKQCFCDGLFINAFPKKPDQPNGTALISEEPSLSAALKEVTTLRRQFLCYFTEGIFIGDSMLSEPVSAFVRGHQLDESLLIIVLNDQAHPQCVTIQSQLDLWLPSAEQYQVRYYDAAGSLIETMPAEGAKWHDTTRPLQPLELAFFEIHVR